MGVVVENIRIKDEFRTSESTNWLLANIGEKITIEVDFRVEERFISGAESEVDRIILEPNTVLAQETNNIDLIYCDDLAAFANFQIGDKITISGSVSGNNGNYIIYEKSADNKLRVTDEFGGSVNFTAETLPFGGQVYITTPFAGIKYFFNFIENESPTNYNSLVSGEEQRLVINDADASDTSTNKPMKFLGSKDYQIGSATIVGRGSSGGKQKFTIVHETILTPLFLANQYSDLVARTKPDYYEAGKCLKYILNIDGGRTLNDPNAIQTVEFDALEGNTGWFNENYNGGKTNYSIESYTLTRVSDATVLSQLELTETVDAVVRIKNTVDSPFVNTSTQFTANFCYLPSEESFYVNNGNTFTENFYFDRAFNTVGSAAIAGDNNGTDQQIMTLVSAAFVDSQTIDVTVRFDLATAAQAIISGRDIKRYMFWITLQDHSLTRNNADKVALLVDVNDFYIELFQADLITNTNTFIQHPYTDKADGVTTPDVFLVDDVAARSDFSIDFTNKINDGIVINTVSNQIVLKNATNPDIILENNTIDVSSAPLEDGLVQFFDEEQNRVFKVPSDIRKVIELKRNSSADAGNVYNWYCNYPFMHRWEYWTPYQLSFLPSGIFDTTEPNNGLNQQWHRPTTISGWTINYRLKFTITQNGEIFEQSFDYPYNSYTFNSNAQWGNESIDTYDVGTGNPLVDGATKFIQGYSDTKVLATFEKLTGDIPLIDDVEIVLWIEVYEQGGIVDIRRISSVYELGSDSWFKSTDASNKVVKQKIGSVYTGEALIDYTKIPDETDFTIYARLYDKSIGEIVDAKLLESGDLKLLENLDNKIIE